MLNSATTSRTQWRGPGGISDTHRTINMPDLKSQKAWRALRAVLPLPWRLTAMLLPSGVSYVNRVLVGPARGVPSGWRRRLTACRVSRAPAGRTRPVRPTVAAVWSVGGRPNRRSYVTARRPAGA